MSFLYFAFAALYGKINQKSFFYFILAACSTASLIARNSLHPHYMKFSKLVSTIFKRKFCLIGYILPYSIAGAVFLQHLKNETSFTAPVVCHWGGLLLANGVFCCYFVMIKTCVGYKITAIRFSV